MAQRPPAPGGDDLGPLHRAASLGLIGGLGHYFVARAFSYGRAAVISPFHYAQLIWASLSPLRPIWEVRGSDRAVYVDQEGRLWEELTPAGPGGASET